MELQQKIIFQNKEYFILSAEQEFMIHPISLQLLPLTMEHVNIPFSSAYSIQKYQLYLDCIHLEEPSEIAEGWTGDKIIKNIPLYYSGAILIGYDPVKDYPYSGMNRPCFSYKYVYELVFNQGLLETSIEHSRSMLRIRKNLELGLRNLNIKRDVRCIRRFIDSIFIGDYIGFSSDNKRLNYIRKLQEYYQTREK